MNRWMLIAFIGMASACHGRTMEEVSFASDAEFDLTISPNSAAQAFDLILNSKSNKSICLDTDQWPNRFGQLHMGSDLAHVTVDGRDYPITDRNFGYCVGEKCTLKIEPYQRLQGRIAFSEFAGWSREKGISNAQLSFTVRPRHC